MINLDYMQQHFVTQISQKLSATKNREYKSTLPRVVDECFASNDGVSMFNAHKLNITKK
jgi:hypothetical protein